MAKKAGRPPIEFDEGLEKQIRSLAMIQCTVEEIAIVTGHSSTTLRRHFGDAIKEGREGGKSSLRRAQFKAALKGNPTMLIWLGKQTLGQKDKLEHELSGPDGGPITTQEQEISEEALEKYEQSLERIISRYPHSQTERDGDTQGDEAGVDQE